ncbi:unnamed protein product [Urochloa decumbens]|uniref:DUF3615 domain-containing protein n=1 Tax=Urochloa decumbens TaxID=240449 RepID=A0ABC9B0N1_9POAL
MELPEQASRNPAAADDDDDGADGRLALHLGGDPAGWLPPALAALLESCSGSSEASGVEAARPPPRLPPSLCAMLRSAISSESGDPGRPPSFELRCLVSLAKSYLPHPPPPPPARKIAHRKMSYRFHASPEIKFELMDVMPANMIIESLRLYTHVNFTAMSAKEGTKEQLFFAELENCSKRRAPSRFIVSHCEPLGSDSTGFQLDYATSAVVKNVNIDITYCFACDSRMLHPRGDKYIAGHCNIPHIYTNTC